MKNLIEFKDDIHKCSRCGLCQAECPIYEITKNDCTVSRGQFVILQGVLNGELKMSKTVNRYLDMCLQCGACAKFCPSGINVTDVIVAAKHEYFKEHRIEKFKTFVQKYFIFGLLPNLFSLFFCSKKSKQFETKVLYFGGCGSKFKGDMALIKVMNSLEIQVVNPKFSCCGISYFARGDLDEFRRSMENYISILKKYNIKTVVTTCASCEKSLKDYIKWANEVDKDFLNNIEVKNIYEYLREKNVRLKLKKKLRATYHKPCNINNFENIEWLLKNVENFEYIEMQDFDKCCGLNGLSKIKEYNIMSKIFLNKRRCIHNTKVQNVLTSCLGCETALKAYSFGQYKVFDLLDFLARYL